MHRRFAAARPRRVPSRAFSSTMMTSYRPDALSDISSQTFIRLYEDFSGYNFSTAKKHTRKDYAVVCPLHSDEHASMSFDPEGLRWFCPVCRVGGGVAEMVLRFEPQGFVPSGINERQRRASAFRWLRDAGYATPDPVEEDFKRRFKLHHAERLERPTLKDIPNPKATNKSGYPVLSDKKTTVFQYTDAQGNVENEVLRFDGKNTLGEAEKYMIQRIVLPAGGAWTECAATSTWDYVLDDEILATVKLMKDGKRRRKPAGPYVYGIPDNKKRRLFHLPEVQAVATIGGLIIVVEGEKKCDALRRRLGIASVDDAVRLGVAVTTWAEGSRAELQQAWLRDVAGAARLWVLADSDPFKQRKVNDEIRVISEGREAALDRAHFFRRVVFDVRALDLFPQREDKSDVDDWLQENPAVSPAGILEHLESVADASAAIG
jgi:hypothetical protein